MSHIKGGGRAPLSEEVEEALTAVLFALREPDTKIQSEHERKREHKRFIKKLKERQDRRALTRKVNQDEGGALETTTSQIQAVTSQLEDNPSSTGNKKVRVELVEAIFGSAGNKGSSKKGGKSSSSKNEYKEGAKKTMVFTLSTRVEDVLKDAKAKLKMKKKPIRCFVVQKKVSVDLVGDLRGIKDGDKVYVTSQEDPTKTTTASSETKPVPSAAADDEEDPLEAVKQAYKQRKRQRRSIRHAPRKVLNELPTFSYHFDKLMPLPPQRANLPAASCRETILEALDTGRVLIVCGATGCGKSTQLPQFLLEGMTAAGLRDSTNIIVSQPRRVAATALAYRVSNEMSSGAPGTKGSEVGYMVRLDRAVSSTSKIVYCTVGILLRMLISPMEAGDDFVEGDTEAVPLSNVSHVVIDEVHERDVNTDFVLTLLRRLLSVNKRIRIILMSATAAAQLFVRYFGDYKPTVIDIPGRSFPVDIKWISECEQFATSSVKGWSPKTDLEADQAKNVSPRATAKIDHSFVKDLISAIVRKQQADGVLVASGGQGARTDGAILVFLPGKAEIEASAKVLYQDPLVGDRSKCNILKLHSTIPRTEQQSVFTPAKGGTVKIVLATNIAETSITIADISHVIDTGRVKESRFNADTRIKELVTVWTSRASAKQRAGRAGRTSAGTCWRLYSEEFCEEFLLPQTSPEILRTPLDELVIQLSLLYENKRDKTKSQHAQVPEGVCPIRFLSNTPEPPSDKSLVEACKHLLEVGALTVVAREPTVLYRLTPLGYHLSRLPMDAKVGKVLLVGCSLGCLENALTVAAVLSNTKSCFPPRWGSVKETEWQSCIQARKSLVENGFGGKSWRGGTVKGDLTATIAVYREWTKKRNDKERAVFCNRNGLDNVALKDMSSLRSQFRDCLKDAGFVGAELDSCNNGANDDALLTSCCLVAGLYPNVATLMRPRKGGPKGGRLLTKDGDVCRPSMGSFQNERVRNVSESGRDAYAVFHAKHRSIGTGGRLGDVFLAEVDFVSRFALLLFGGELSIEKNALIVDGWLKFKVGDKGANNGIVLLQELRSQLDAVLLEHVTATDGRHEVHQNNERLLLVLRQLLTEES
ncbi:Putative ATP-dependent RNA helicase DHX30 [Seminavis robusta]|uniref:ATP-dependent RNA helicase DHX30 n=1 Tax=Seminavis robusta TaxID=568900 RepID=A0A9N8HXJ7_9STRA|nr:Putative ATP-dependent RNA helicase DHX30 [Seminavis robusta]|eukprot:Sro2231_g320050.1 Putative ATP-dependent RNA helicase DHX30 (1099) ;mRNA; f:4839-8404